MTFKLGIIGAGNMAEAIARAAIDNGVLTPDQITAADPYQDRRDALAHIGIVTTEHNADVVRNCEQLMLAVKPQVWPKIVGDLSADLRDDQVVISIMTGIRAAKLCDDVGRPVRVVRVMPNTPVQVGAGMAGVALGEQAKPGDDELTLKIFNAGQSKAIAVPESLLDSVTAVSGSGPAYLFYLAEAMERGANDLGIDDPAEARQFVVQTLLGAARLLDESGLDPQELRRRVTSPNGTTQAAMEYLDAQHVPDAIVEAMRAGQRRSVELGSG